MDISSNGSAIFSLANDTLFYPHRYNLSSFEQLLMVIITGISNFAFTPALILLIKKKYYFPVFLGLFTEITSFMYHFMESIALKSFLNMDEGQWHKLDNIGSISCFMSLAVYMMDNRNAETDTILNFSALILNMILQESDPWNLSYTVVPILVYFLMIYGVSWCRDRKTVYKRKMHIYGVFTIIPGVICFYLGLDEFKDYLRFFHGCWHFFVGVSSFYIWQVNTPEGEETLLGNLFKKRPYTEIKFNID